MLITDEKSRAAVGDKIRFNLKGKPATDTLEGVVTYDFNRNICVVTESSSFNFEDLESWDVIDIGPFHSVGDNPTWSYAPDCFGDLFVTDVASDTTETGGPFSYRFGESACEVFERWSLQLNKLDKKVKSLKKKARNG